MPVELIGGKQTVGPPFQGGNGLEYDFRPVVKSAGAVLPRWVRAKWILAALDDQMAAQFPLGAVVVARSRMRLGLPRRGPCRS